MLRNLLVVSSLVAVLAVAAWMMTSPSPTTSTPEPTPTTAQPDPSSPGLPSTARRSVLENVAKAPSAEPAEPAEPVEPAQPNGPRPYQLQVGAEPALSGLELDTLSDSDRERLEIPDEYGRGVMVTRVHPDAPAAVAGLQKGDVIVRALLEKIDTPSDLRKTVGDRKQTVVIAVRSGELMHLVLQKPYKGS